MFLCLYYNYQFQSVNQYYAVFSQLLVESEAYPMEFVEPFEIHIIFSQIPFFLFKLIAHPEILLCKFLPQWCMSTQFQFLLLYVDRISNTGFHPTH